MVLAPLVLTAGTWTLLISEPPALLKVLVPSGLPEAGLRATLGSVYWPTLEMPGAWSPYYETPPPNIWKPPFPLAYAMALVVLERVAARADHRWLGRVTLALLIGFLGLVEETVALTVLGLWLLLALLTTVKDRSGRLTPRTDLRRTFAGPMLALLLLAVGGGPLTGVLTGGLGGSLSLRQPEDLGEPRLWGSFEPLTGGIGALSLGSIPVAAAALILAWRQRLVLALTLGAGVFVLAAVTVQFSAFQFDVGRLDGHARNFALLALLVALGARLHPIRPHWRYVAAGGLIVLIIWPTIATPILKDAPSPGSRNPAFQCPLLRLLRTRSRRFSTWDGMCLEPFATERITLRISAVRTKAESTASCHPIR